MRLTAAKKYIISSTACLLIAVVACAQVCDTVAFQNIYWFKGILNSAALKGLADKNNNIILAGNADLDVNDFTNSFEQRALIIKTNKRGTPLWAKAYGAGTRDIIGDFTLDKDNSIVMAGNTRISRYDGEPWIAKVDEQGNLVWSLGLGQGAGTLSKVITLADGSFAAIGWYPLSYTVDQLGNIVNPTGYRAIVLCVNSNGVLRWAKDFSSPIRADVPQDIIQLTDGNLLMSGASLYLDNFNHAFLIKLDITTGATIHAAAFKGFPAWKLAELPGKKIRLYGGYNICDIDSNLSPLQLKEIKYNQNFYNIPEVVKLNSGTDNAPDTTFYCGNITKGASFILVIFKMIGDSTMQWAHSYHLQTNIGSTNYLTATVLNNNTFGVCGPFNTMGFSTDFNPPKSESQTYFLQTDAEGNMPCAEDVSFTFKATPVPAIGFMSEDLSSYSFQIAPVPSAATNLLPRYLLDCYTSTCCRDTVIYKDASICEGSSYTLPDGTTVDKQGVYTAVFQKSKGCDSMLITNLTVNKPLQASLGNDTCLLNNVPVTYKLSYADSTVQYKWQNNVSDSVYTITKPGKYWVKVTNQCGSASDTVVVYPNCALPLYIPTAFTPNGDGRNDVFRIADMKGMHLLSFAVYNRFGGKMFYTADASKGWNGNVNGIAQQAGTYVYVITYKDLSGNVKTMKNSFVLLR